MDAVFEYSAGGIVTTHDDRLVIVQARNLKGDTVFTLPKGHIETGETSLAAAAREVREETGYEVTVMDSSSQKTTYWFVHKGDRVKKTVTWFRFAVVGGDPADHDDEIEQVLAMDVETGLETLTYESDRIVVRSALCD